ncbi:ArsR/SmtB family transcription factor [Halopelagius fulvigenes]|uniref:ArsR/SmtB family transcription factor n=1 Tax=Halopelagius fulvigenes TaxID=1198324 RepID=A0ABD5TWC9_9EURY
MSGWDADSAFDLLGNELARKILVLTSERALSAEELTRRCDASQPTVYRRLDALESYDMVAEKLRYDADGNHYSAYECRLEELRFGVEDGGFTVDIELRRTVAGEGDGESVSRRSATGGVGDVGDTDAL